MYLHPLLTPKIKNDSIFIVVSIDWIQGQTLGRDHTTVFLVFLVDYEFYTYKVLVQPLARQCNISSIRIIPIITKLRFNLEWTIWLKM